MSLVFVTGISGSGKSTVRQELRSRGYEAWGTDEDKLSGWYDKQTGASVAMPPREVWATPAWREQNDWHLDRQKIEAIADRIGRSTAFICGTAANEGEVWDLFSQVFYLLIDEATLRSRISERINNDFGKEPHELEAILGWLRDAEANYTRFGANIIDASRPLGEVVDEILALIPDSAGKKGLGRE